MRIPTLKLARCLRQRRGWMLLAH